MANKTFKCCAKFQDVVITECKGAIGKVSVGTAERYYLNPNPWFETEDGWFDAEWTKNAGPGDYLYISIFVKSYTLGDVSYTVPDGPIVEYTAVFKWEDDVIYINPMSTVAGIYTFSKRMQAGTITGYEYLYFCGTKDFCDVAYAMKGNLNKTSSETISAVISSSPNGMESNSMPMFNFLCNILYYSLTDSQTLADFTKLKNAKTCGAAMLGIAQNPWDDVQAIYDLVCNKKQVYWRSLTQLAEVGRNPVPNQWTLAVKVNKSGSDNFLIAGTAFTVFDKENKAWVTNNFRQGSDKSGTHCLVFNPDGSPADISPLTGGGILGAGFGVAVTPDGETIAIGNFGWGTPDFNPAYGSISVFNYKGEVLCPPAGYTNGLTRVQGMSYDSKGNLWMASWGTQDPMADPTSTGNYTPAANNSAIVCYLGGDPDKMLSYSNFNGFPSEHNGTFALVVDPSDDSVIVSNAGGKNVAASAVYRIQLVGEELQLQSQWLSDYVNPSTTPSNFEQFRQPQIDSKRNIYVGGIISSRVVMLNKDLVKQNEFTSEKNKIYGPWGITIDKKDKKFVCGFGIVDQKTPSYGPFGITVVESDDTDWTNTRRMTLPSGGAPVLLANGQKLYGNWVDSSGNPIPDSYEPLMRLTATSIDRAGNLWCANNWKPDLNVDAGPGGATNPGGNNPGGDGIVIFLGVAEPIDSVPQA